MPTSSSHMATGTHLRACSCPVPENPQSISPACLCDEAPGEHAPGEITATSALLLVYCDVADLAWCMENPIL